MVSNDIYWVPRGYTFYMTRWFRNKGIPFKVLDYTQTLPSLNLKFSGENREYQEKAIQDMLSYPTGVLVASTGSGKTVMACRIIAKRQQPTLIIVHSKELMNQWRDSIKKFLGIKCGQVGDSRIDIMPITVGIINSVRTRTSELDKYFGHVICDECHRISASTWSDTLQDFSAKHYLGLTATPFRKDGLGNAIFASIGPKLHTVSKEVLHDIGAVLKPKIYCIPTDFTYLWTNDYSTMMSELTQDEARNQLIIEQIQADYARFKEPILIVSDRKKHCETLSEMLGIDNRVLTGSTPKYEREGIVNDIKNKRCPILISTIQLVGEGFDLPELSALFLTTPIKFSGRILQVAGRILRPSEGKVPRIYDFRDDYVDVLKYSGYNRDRIYKKQWGI
jgi:superfamily II DNA or RNA helicase